MKYSIIFAAVLAALAVSACDKKPTVVTPAVVSLVVDGVEQADAVIRLVDDLAEHQVMITVNQGLPPA